MYKVSTQERSWLFVFLNCPMCMRVIESTIPNYQLIPDEIINNDIIAKKEDDDAVSHTKLNITKEECQSTIPRAPAQHLCEHHRSVRWLLRQWIQTRVQVANMHTNNQLEENNSSPHLIHYIALVILIFFLLFCIIFNLFQ